MTKTYFGPFSVEMFDLNICLILGHKFLHNWEASLWTLDIEVSGGKWFYTDLNYEVMLFFRTIYQKGNEIAMLMVSQRWKKITL